MYEGEENLQHMKKRSNYRCEKHLFWDADYVCSEYRGRNIVLAELYSSRLMAWTNNIIMMRKNPTGRWRMTECGRWISLGTAMKMNTHRERYAKEEM